MTASDAPDGQGFHAIEKRIKSRLRIGDFYPVTSTLFNSAPATEIFFQGCPWRCQHCPHAHLQSPVKNNTLDWQDILYYLMGRRGLIDHVVFNGAEPLSQTHTIEAIMQCKTMGFTVGLHTCGIYPLRLETALPLIDWLWFEVMGLPEHYDSPSLNPGSGYTAWQGLGVAAGSGVPVVCELKCESGTTVREDLPRIVKHLTALHIDYLVLTVGESEPTVLSDCSDDIQAAARQFRHFKVQSRPRITGD